MKLWQAKSDAAVVEPLQKAQSQAEYMRPIASIHRIRIQCTDKILLTPLRDIRRQLCVNNVLVHHGYLY